MWALSSYSFHYLFIVFKQPLVSNLKPHCFHLDSSLKRSSDISNWLSQIPTQSSLVNSELLFFIPIQYTISRVQYVYHVCTGVSVLFMVQYSKTFVYLLYHVSVLCTLGYSKPFFPLLRCRARVIKICRNRTNHTSLERIILRYRWTYCNKAEKISMYKYKQWVFVYGQVE